MSSFHSTTHRHRLLWWLGTSMLALLACRKDRSDGVAVRESAPSITLPSATASASTTREPPAPPTMALVSLKLPELTEDVTLHTIDGAVLVSMNDGSEGLAPERSWARGSRLGRLLPKGVEWLGATPKGSPALGPDVIVHAYGRWPEEVALVYMSSNPRDPHPVYLPIKGGGGEYLFNPSGAPGWPIGVAYSGGTTTIAAFAYLDGYRIVKVRGPMLKPRPTLAKELGCEPPPEDYGLAHTDLAVTPVAYASTRAGTILSLGSHCKDRRVALEIWKKPGEPSRIVIVQKWFPHGDGTGTAPLRGPGDTLYLVSDSKNPILRYRDGEVGPLPKLRHQRRQAFVSPDGALYATDGLAIFELVEDRWIKRADLQWSNRDLRIARDGQRFVATHGGKLYELKPARSIALDPQLDSVDCKTPFLHLFDVNADTQKRYRFPDTAKGLSTLAHLDRIELVDFEHDGRRIGIIADDWETAKALDAHVRKTLPKEQGRLLCFVPSEPRVLEVKPANAATPTKAPAAPSVKKPEH